MNFFSVLLASEQVKKCYVSGIGNIGTAILTLLWVLLSFFAFPYTEAEAASIRPTREEICGMYEITQRGARGTRQGTMTIRLRGNNYEVSYGGKDLSNYRHKSFTYKPDTGRADIEYYEKAGGSRIRSWFFFSKNGNSITIKGTTLGFEITGKKIRSNTTGPGASTGTPQPKNPAPQKKTNPANQDANQQKNTATQSKGDTDNSDKSLSNKDNTNQQNGENDDYDDLPESDAAKAAAAVGTAVVGGLLGGAAGSAGGAAGSAGGGYGPGEDGYGTDEGDKESLPDNLAVADDGSIRITTPTGEELVYTRNEDGTYNIPTQTETGENLVDENGNTMEPGMVTTQEEILKGAQWYKDNEQAMLADRAAEDARQQAERDRLAAENAKWLEKERLVNSQLSRLSIELQEEERKLAAQQKQDDFVEKMRWEYGHGDESLSKDDLKKIMKKEQVNSDMEGGYHDQESATWEERTVTAQEVKFVADQSVNAYAALTHNQAFANIYSAATNYGGTMMDAAVNHKDMGKAFVKATVDTALDMAANKLEDHGWHVTGNAGAQVYKQVNDNLYNGRDAWEDADEAAYTGALTGAAGKGFNKLGEMSQGTVFGQEIGGAGLKPKLNTDAEIGSTGSKPGTNLGAETKGVRKTGIAERRTGQGQYKTNTPMSEAEARMQLNEDVQANRSMNEVRKLNKISQQMDAMEKASPQTYQSDPEYQKLSQQFEAQHKVVREDKVAIDRMNALQGETGTNLRKHYNQTDMAYEKKVLQYRNESIAQEYGLKPNQIGDTNVTSNKDSLKAAGGKASHDTDTSPYMKVNTGEGKNAKVDFTQVDGDHHLVRAIYKAEHGRYPQTAAEYDEALRLKQVRDFTNVSTRPSDTHETYRNPDAYVGSGKGDVNKVLHPDQYGTPDKGTGVFNEQTAIHKQGAPLERHRQQYAEAQKLREQLKTDTTLSASEKTEMGKKIADLEKQSASNHYESTRTTVKEADVINGINNENIKNGLGDGMSDDARYIGNLAKQVKEGKIDNATYKQIVTEKYGSEEAAQRIVAKGFRDTNK